MGGGEKDQTEPRGVGMMLNKSAYKKTGRCGECRTWEDSIGPSGVCYTCAALASGDLIECKQCGYWTPVEEADKPCEVCGAPPSLDHCRLCDAHVSEPHDLTCAVGALAEIADAWAEMGTDDTAVCRAVGDVLIRAGVVSL